MIAPTGGTPLRDVLDIPERVYASDFVLQLHSGVDAADRTLADYVVTKALADSFDEALGLIGQTLRAGTSKGAFVHGSFGSGKSHFMAVLHLLLTGHPTARALPGLQEVVARRQGVLQTNVLCVDYHLLGKESFEGALFEGYLDTVKRLHPDARPAVLHRSDALFADAEALRAKMDAGAFFGALNSGSSGGSGGWGSFATAWDAASFAAAVSAPVGDGERTRLAQDLTSTLFTSYQHSGQWLGIEEGLAAMTEHARGLGYAGVVLFLDELVLWLAQHLGDTTFIQSETSKVAKLVETGLRSMPIPLISFVARQRDLKDFLGGSAVGAEQVALGQSFQWWEDRFEKVELRAADLPQIVHQRLLTPTTPAGEVAIKAAVDQVKAHSAAWAYLLSDSASSSEVDFRLVYPFSPALVDALIALSSLMQRERTALRLMGELLSNGRDELTVSDVIPVGDLFDVVVLGSSKPLTADMQRHFEIARAFYTDKMRPHLLAKHGLTEAQAAALPRSHAFRTEDRLAKTLLVAAIAPGTPSLKNLTAGKLAALNYGTVHSFIPGQESVEVLGHVRAWAGEFGEVTIGEGADPIVSVQLAGVDYESIVELVRTEDHESNHRALLRELISAELGIPAQTGLLADRVHTFVWRGSKREVDVVFGNVRDEEGLPDHALRASSNRWKVVIDYPFDIGNHSPQEDLNRLARLRNAGVESQTIAWLPHFLTSARLADVGRLVLLEYLLKGERFDQYANHLAVGDREPARIALDNQRRSLRARLGATLREAYAVATANPENVEKVIASTEVFSTLYTGLTIQPPVAASLQAALNAVLGQALAFQYPKHPEFDPGESEVKRSELATVLEYAQKAVAQGGRVEGIERPKAATLRRVAGPLGCGSPRENVYALSADSFRWWDIFTKANAELASGGEVTVAALRGRLVEYGMLTDVEDLLILVWTLLEDREFVRYGAVVPPPGIGGLAPDLVLRPPRLPDAASWTEALRRAEVLWGVPREPRLSAAGVGRVARAVRAKAKEQRTDAIRLVREVTRRREDLGVAEDDLTGRLHTARRAVDLVEALGAENDDASLVEVLAIADLPAEPQALATSLSSARPVATALEGFDWELLVALGNVPPERAEPIRASLAAAARAEELHVRLAPALAEARASALKVIVDRRLPDKVVVDGSEGDETPDHRDDKALPDVDAIELVIPDGDLRTTFTDLETAIAAALEQHPGKRAKVRWWLE